MKTVLSIVVAFVALVGSQLDAGILGKYKTKGSEVESGITYKFKAVATLKSQKTCTVKIKYDDGETEVFRGTFRTPLKKAKKNQCWLLTVQGHQMNY